MMTVERFVAALRSKGLPLIADTLFTDERGVAFLLGKSKRTLREWRAAGKGPPYAALGRVLYDLEDLALWVNAQTRPAAGGGERRKAAEVAVSTGRTSARESTEG